MRICFLANADHPNTLNWTSHFARVLKHDVHIISFNGTEFDTRALNIHIIRSVLSRSKLRYILACHKVRTILRSIQPDLLIGYRITSYGFMGSLLNFHPFILAAQGQNIVYPNHSVLLNLAARYALRKADLINSWAPHMTEKMISLGASPNNILTLPRGVNTDLFKPIKHNLNPTTFRIVSTRSLRPEPHYNIEPILRAVQILVGHIPEIEYVVLGDGPRKQSSMENARKMKIDDRVIFFGAVEHGKIPSVLRTCQVYVSNVWSDGVSASLLEAMSCGLFPIVVDNVSNRDWILDGENGFLVPPDNPKRMSHAIKRAFEDRHLRSRASKMNRKIVVERASWHSNMAQIEAAYLQVANRR